MRIAFIGFGEAARAFRDSLAARDPELAFAAYDILLDAEGTGGACANAMREHGVEIATSAKGAVDDSEWVFSAVTADQSLAAATQAAKWLKPGRVLFDINSVSPERKRENAALVQKRGAVYIDMAVMAPVHPNGHATPTLIAGAADDALAARLADFGFAFDVVGPEPGAATAIKMVRSLFVKGLEAITVETLLAAAASRCFDRVLASLDGSYPELKLPELARYQFERTRKHGTRRAAEMRESAATLDALGLTGRLADAIADVQETMGALPKGAKSSDTLADEVARTLTLRLRATSSGSEGG